MCYCHISSDNSSGQPPLKKAVPQTSSVVVEQSGDSDKVLIDQVMDPDMIFEDVSILHTCNTRTEI